MYENLEEMSNFVGQKYMFKKIYTEYHNNTNKQQKERSKISQSILFDLLVTLVVLKNAELKLIRGDFTQPSLIY